ncbi:hyphally regulated cell wall protein 1-like [Pollicipes pollicipes]|uniref:hyphally regulated cell wall protein 1-like n=1 Tax=Pollicipes pollicipes TaxID=41117 RepID=UPI0018855A4B|nr:hyphally regulated cell wall protein 1-like [Pollicipes pollicipes]
MTRHRPRTLISALEVLTATDYQLVVRDLPETHYRTVTDHVYFTDTVNNHVRVTVTVPRPTTVTELTTVFNSYHETNPRVTIVTRLKTATRTEVSTRTEYAVTTALVTERRTLRTTHTSDVTTTLPAATVTSTLLFCPATSAGYGSSSGSGSGSSYGFSSGSSSGSDSGSSYGFSSAQPGFSGGPSDDGAGLLDVRFGERRRDGSGDVRFAKHGQGSGDVGYKHVARDSHGVDAAEQEQAFEDTNNRGGAQGLDQFELQKGTEYNQPFHFQPTH